ncbi:MAG: substrate-binding domain-containing protein, partial [Lachnospiraceae bacterium]|nr:substrate-binding domain-containing protein [Lachnospiraceae bacterium]
MKKIIVPIILGLSAATAVLLGMWFYYNKSIREIEEQSMASSTVYDKHYAMISGEDDSLLWRSIYNSAREYASGENAYLEWVGADSVTDYLAEDCIRIGIASKVDGIILQPDGSSTMTDLINSAAEQGIPVVTVLNDDSESSRVSFVGLNSYQMGEIYGQQILKLLGEGETSIQVLTHSSTEDINTNLMYSKMNSVVEQGKKKGQTVNISTYSIDNSMSFDAEEVIRDIFVNSETLPDILICLDSVSTECACQAIIDYNEVGNVDIIG